jgi:hypothetical protein
MSSSSMQMLSSANKSIGVSQIEQFTSDFGELGIKSQVRESLGN